MSGGQNEGDLLIKQTDSYKQVFDMNEPQQLAAGMAALMAAGLTIVNGEVVPSDTFQTAVAGVLASAILSQGPTVGGDNAVDLSALQATLDAARFILSVAAAIQVDGSSSSSAAVQLTAANMVATMMKLGVEFGSQDNQQMLDAANAMLIAAEARKEAQTAKLQDTVELAGLAQQVSSKRGCRGIGARIQMRNKLESMGYSRKEANSMVRSMQRMPPHMAGLFAMAAVQASPKHQMLGAVAAVSTAKANASMSAAMGGGALDLVKALRTIATQGKEESKEFNELMLALMLGQTMNAINGGVAVLAAQMASGSFASAMGMFH